VEDSASDVYKYAVGIFGLVLKFATTRMTLPGAGVIAVDNTPSTQICREYFRHDMIRARQPWMSFMSA